MPDDRTRRFDRLLAMRRQLERLAQWRLAAARRERLDADARSAAAQQAIELRLEERFTILGEEAGQGTVQTALFAEKKADRDLQEARTLAATRRKAERLVQDALLSAQRKTKQAERLTDDAHRTLDEAEQRALQIEWDEHGRRKDRKGIAMPHVDQIVTADTDNDRESLP